MTNLLNKKLTADERGNLDIAFYHSVMEESSPAHAGKSHSESKSLYEQCLTLLDCAKDDLFYYQEVKSCKSNLDKIQACIPDFKQEESNRIRHKVEEISSDMEIMGQNYDSQTNWESVSQSCDRLIQQFPLNAQFYEVRQIATNNLSLKKTVFDLNSLKDTLSHLTQGPLLLFPDESSPQKENLKSLLQQLDSIQPSVKQSHPSNEFYLKEIGLLRRSILDLAAACIYRELGLEKECRRGDFDQALIIVKAFRERFSDFSTFQIQQFDTWEKQFNEKQDEYKKLVKECGDLIEKGKIDEVYYIISKLYSLASDNQDGLKLEEQLKKTQANFLIQQYTQWFSNKDYFLIKQSLTDERKGEFFLSESQRRVWHQKVNKRLKWKRVKNWLL